MTDIEKIARGLTKAQRENIMNAQDMMSNHQGFPLFTVKFDGAWEYPVAEFLSFRVDRLTPLGLQVRDFLRSKENG